MGFPGGSVVKNLPATAGDVRDAGSISRSGRSAGRKWQPTPVFLPGKSHGQRSLAGYSLWGHKRVGHDLVTKQQQQGNTIMMRKGDRMWAPCHTTDHKNLRLIFKLRGKKTHVKGGMQSSPSSFLKCGSRAGKVNNAS